MPVAGRDERPRSSASGWAWVELGKPRIRGKDDDEADAGTASPKRKIVGWGLILDRTGGAGNAGNYLDSYATCLPRLSGHNCNADRFCFGTHPL